MGCWSLTWVFLGLAIVLVWCFCLWGTVTTSSELMISLALAAGSPQIHNPASNTTRLEWSSALVGWGGAYGVVGCCYGMDVGRTVTTSSELMISLALAAGSPQIHNPASNTTRLEWGWSYSFALASAFSFLLLFFWFLDNEEGLI
ncbi:hypothetical protein U1Q18_005249 [Sarracenia purpurea var. burkii]